MRGLHHIVEEIVTDDGPVHFLAEEVYYQHIAGCSISIYGGYPWGHCSLGGAPAFEDRRSFQQCQAVEGISEMERAARRRAALKAIRTSGPFNEPLYCLS
jgi:hypothetical protein